MKGCSVVQTSPRRRAAPPAVLLACLAAPALAQDAPPVLELAPITVEAAPAPPPSRTAIDPTVGAARTEITRQTIEALPQGANASLSQVLLQAPGVVQEAAGDIHVRGDHRNLQYRLNGVTLPEGIGGFAQALSARGLSAASLTTGALPAQYGYRTAGVIELQLRDPAQDPGGSIDLYGGSRGTFQPGISYGGSAAGWDYFATGSGLFSQRGLENPTSAPTAIHNRTEQWRGFGYASRQLDPDTRLTLLGGASIQRFQIPNIPGQTPQYQAFGRTQFDSAALTGRQWERSYFGVAALNHRITDGEVQVAAFSRFASLHYLPDPVGDLMFTGNATDAYRRSIASGVQADATWHGIQGHTLRGGLFVSADATRSRNLATVLPVVAGNAIDAPFTIATAQTRLGWLAGLYVQDSWALTDQLTLNLGARFDAMWQNTRAQQLSPRAGLVWRPDEATTLSIGYARYFTPPPQELAVEIDPRRFRGTTLEPEVLRADPVRPERSHYFNIGANRRFGDHLTVGLEAYYRTVRDMQDLGQFGTAYIFSPYNYREGRAFGTELSIGWRQENLFLYANLALSRSEGRGLVSNQYFWSVAEQAQVARKFVRTDHDQLVTASAGGAWQAWEGGRLSFSTLYGSGMRRGFANSDRMTPYATVNLGVAQDLRLADGGAWTLRFDVVNLLDRRYQLRDGTGIGVGAPQFGTRRGFFVGLSRSL